MERKEFLKICGFASIGGATFSLLQQSCISPKMLSGNIEGTNLIVSLSDFETKAGSEIHFKKYIVINNDRLEYPICVFRFDEKNYSALWMRCTHQGAELQVFGDKLQCPAHGSEFDSKGNILTSPADKALRNFPITIEGNQLKISLKAA
jgi:Rieske Fe-S protein